MPDTDSARLLADIGRKTRKMREEAGMTQGGLARRLRTTKVFVCKIEEGRQHNLRLATLIRIAAVFGRRVKLTFVKRKGGV